MEIKSYLGIDPGASGGLAVVSSELELLGTWKTPKGLTELTDLYGEIASRFNPVVAVIEKLTGYVGGYSGRKGDTGASMMKLGTHYGRSEMGVVMSGIRLEYATPAVWQRSLGIVPRKKSGKSYVETKPEFKRRLRDVARQLYPRSSISLNVCDAVLLAEYARRRYSG